jgi:hypothetical protein
MSLSPARGPPLQLLYVTNPSLSSLDLDLHWKRIPQGALAGCLSSLPLLPCGSLTAPPALAPMTHWKGLLISWQSQAMGAGVLLSDSRFVRSSLMGPNVLLNKIWLKWFWTI